MAKKRKFENKVLTFITIFLMMFSGLYYLGLNYVPLELYETQTMPANQKEDFYVTQWCDLEFGRKEAVLWDMVKENASEKI